MPILTTRKDSVKEHKHTHPPHGANSTAAAVHSAITPWKLIISLIPTQENISHQQIITSTHLIYMILCPCGLAHVGKIARKLKQRISEHKSTMLRNNQDNPIAVHFNDVHHDIATLRFCGIGPWQTTQTVWGLLGSCSSNIGSQGTECFIIS